MGAMTSQITKSSVHSDADHRKHKSSVSLAFVWGIHRRLVNSPHKGTVTRKMFPFDDVIVILPQLGCSYTSMIPSCWTHYYLIQCPFVPMIGNISAKTNRNGTFNSSKPGDTWHMYVNDLDFIGFSLPWWHTITEINAYSLPKNIKLMTLKSICNK